GRGGAGGRTAPRCRARLAPPRPPRAGLPSPRLGLFGAGIDWWPPAQGSARVLAPDRARDLWRQGGGGGSTAVDLPHAPGGAGIELGDRLHAAKPGDEINLVAAVSGGQ